MLFVNNSPKAKKMQLVAVCRKKIVSWFILKNNLYAEIIEDIKIAKANQRMCGVASYPFNIMGGGWEKFSPKLKDLPFKGDTVVGNDVWIGQNVTVMPGVHIGDGAIIAANSVVVKDVPAYCVAGGNPCRVIRKRFDDGLTEYLLSLKWWDWNAEKIFRNMEALCSGDLEKIRNIKDI